MPHARIEDALAAARPGDAILVHPLPDGKPYERVAICVNRPRISIKGAAGPRRRVGLSGRGYDYSGRGSIPRAVIQFSAGADVCALEGFGQYDHPPSAGPRPDDGKPDHGAYEFVALPR